MSFTGNLQIGFSSWFVCFSFGIEREGINNYRWVFKIAIGGLSFS